MGFYKNSFGQWSFYFKKHLIHLSDFKIISYFYSWWWKFFFYYMFCHNNFKLSKIYFLFKYSCIKTLIFKHNKLLNSFTKVFCIFRSNVVAVSIYFNIIFIWFNSYSFMVQNFSNLDKFTSSFCFNELLVSKVIINKLWECVNCKKTENIFFYTKILCFFCYKLYKKSTGLL